jgi:hypothetical protein
VFLGYLRSIISAVNFYYIINKLIIFITGSPLKVPVNMYLPVFNH